MTWCVVGRTCSGFPSSGEGLGSSSVVGEFSRCVTEVFHLNTTDWCCWVRSYAWWVRRRLPNMPSGKCVAQTGSSRKDLPQILHTFLIRSPEKGWGVFVPISLTHWSPESCVVKTGFTALRIKQHKTASGLFHYVGLKTVIQELLHKGLHCRWHGEPRGWHQAGEEGSPHHKNSGVMASPHGTAQIPPVLQTVEFVQCFSSPPFIGDRDFLLPAEAGKAEVIGNCKALCLNRKRSVNTRSKLKKSIFFHLTSLK